MSEMSMDQADKEKPNFLDQYSTDELIQHIRERISKNPLEADNLGSSVAFQDLLTQLEQRKSENKLEHVTAEAKPWLEKIKTHFLHGKFGDNWIVDGRPIQLDSRGHTDFKNAEISGAFAIPPEFIGHRYSQYPEVATVNRIADWFYRNDSLDPNRETNYFIIGKPDKALSETVGISTPVIPISYLMWSHLAHTPDARGHHIPLRYTFFLPEVDAEEFVKQTTENPQLVEEIFKAQHPDLLQAGQVQRTKAKQLAFVRAEDIIEPPFTATEQQDPSSKWNTIRIRSIKPHQVVPFIKPIGEV